MGQKKKHHILPTYLFAKALVPSKSEIHPVFHALSVCDTTSFSADHGIAKILNIDFCQFFSHWKEVLLLLKPWNKILGSCLCGRAEETKHHLHSFRFLSEAWGEFHNDMYKDKSIEKERFYGIHIEIKQLKVGHILLTMKLESLKVVQHNIDYRRPQ